MLSALREVGQVLVRQVDKELLHVVPRQLDEVPRVTQSHGGALVAVLGGAAGVYFFAPSLLPEFIRGKEAAGKKRWKIIDVAPTKGNTFLNIELITDSTKAAALVKLNKWNPVKSFNEQCYAIRIDSARKNIYVFAAESTGTMYGALDIAEAIECNSLGELKESDNAPYLKNRGIKFNIPLDLRTPTYSDPGDANQLNITNVWNLNFWQTYFDEMAIHRYNVMTWWSLQPFPSMVKVPEFPDVALKDVWRTKEKYDDHFSGTGVDFDKPYLFKNVEVIKKMTIDEKIIFWKKVMQLAADRGIDIYLFTWNMFTYGATGKNGITRKQDNDTTIKWYRASVREMIKTYPLLRGIGITAGEGMENNRKDMLMRNGYGKRMAKVSVMD